MTAGPIAQLIELQEPDGCFPSEITTRSGRLSDRNGFTTARVLRALRDIPTAAEVERLRSRALDFLERCRSTRIAGAFGFWPADARPAWAVQVPEDIDDTAIMTIELLRHGRLSQRDGLHTVCTVLLPHRVIGDRGQPGPAWIAPGAFLTWIGRPDKPNVVDCCVNANAAALMALVGATHLPGFQEAVCTVLDGIEWAGRQPTRQRSLTPFYPSLEDLREAVKHAHECGAQALGPALHQLAQMANERPPEVKPGCCSSAYGAAVWHCRALEQAQAVRHSMRPATV